jgi:FHA domain-containing protein
MMLQRLWRWVSPHARRGRVQEVFGELREACESYVIAGLERDAARVLERLADDPALGAAVRLGHYERALEMLADADPEAEERLAGKILSLLEQDPPGSKAFRRRCELLRRLGRFRELAADMERAGDYSAAMQAYADGGLVEEIDRIAELGAQSRARRNHVEQLFEELERARAEGDRLAELVALRELASDEETGERAARLRADLERLGRRRLGSPILLAGNGLKASVEIVVASGLVLGRDPDVDVRIAAPGVSRRHARLYAHEERLYVEDLGSRNRTWLDGLPLEGFVEIAGRSRLGLGSEVQLELAELPRVGPGAPGLVLHGRPLPRPVLLLCGPVELTAGAGPIELQHPALDVDAPVLRLLPARGEMLVAPAPGGPAVLLGGTRLERAQLPYADESLEAGGLSLELRRLGIALPPAHPASDLAAR